VQAILGSGEVVPELRELILGMAGGNPLFVEELTQSLLENGSIQRKDHEYVLSRRSSEIVVPHTIQGIISARIDRVEESLKRIMQRIYLSYPPDHYGNERRAQILSPRSAGIGVYRRKEAFPGAGIHL
jgi:hypothetical protein